MNSNLGAHGPDCTGTSSESDGQRTQRLIDKRIRNEKPAEPKANDALKACDACLPQLKKQKRKQTNPAEVMCDCDMCKLKHLCVEHAYKCQACDVYTCKKHRQDHWLKYHEDDCGPYYSSDESNSDEDDGQDKKEEQAEEQIHGNPQEEEYDYTDWTEEQFKAYMEREEGI